MSILGIIPARYASVRFPGKPLAEVNGRPMILRVVDQAVLSGVFDDIVVATDDHRIFSLVTGAGFQAVMTLPSHRSGTERSLEALGIRESQRGAAFDHVINIQGDEPYIHPDQIRKVASLLTQSDCQIATLAKLITHREEIFNPHVVKIVFDIHMNALYFSRAPIPWLREISETRWTRQKAHYKHIGIYGYRVAALRSACGLPAGVLEKHESLEQLRWLEHGLPIKIEITELDSISVDTPEDLLKITNMD